MIFSFSRKVTPTVFIPEAEKKKAFFVSKLRMLSQLQPRLPVVTSNKIHYVAPHERELQTV